MIFALAFSLHIFLGVFFGQGSRPLAWASTPWAICRTDRLSTIDYRPGGGGFRSLFAAFRQLRKTQDKERNEREKKEKKIMTVDSRSVRRVAQGVLAHARGRLPCPKS